MAKHDRPAQSNYWALQVAVTWNSTGGVTWHLKGKQRHQDWRDVSHLEQGFLRLDHEAEGSMAEGLALLEEVIGLLTLPRDPS